MIAAVVVLALLALLVCVVLVFVLIGASRGMFGGVGRAPTAALVAPSAAAGTGSAPTTNPSQASTNPAAIGVGNATTITETTAITTTAAGPVLFAPNGTLIAVGLGNAVLLRDATSLAVERTLSPHGGDVFALAFSPDSSTLASGAFDDSTIRVWNSATGQLLREIQGHEGWVRTLAFSPNGRMLASGSTDATIRLWDAATWEPIRTLRGHTDYVSRLAFSPDGATLASTSRDGTVRLWDVASGNQRPNIFFTAPNNPNPTATTPANSPYWMTGLAFSPDGTLLAAGSVDRTVRVWNVASGVLERTLQGHTNWVLPNTLAFSPDGKTLASSGVDGTVRLWDPISGAERGTLTDHGLQILGLAFAPDGSRIATTSDQGGSLVLWDTVTQQIAKRERLGQGVITALAYSHDGALLATSGLNGNVEIHVIGTDRTISIVGGAPTAQAVAFLNEKEIAAISDNGGILRLNLTQEAQGRTFAGLNSPALSVAVTSDGTTVAAGSLDGSVGLWDATSGDARRIVKTQLSKITALAFSSDGAWLAIGSNDDQPALALINVASGDQKMLSTTIGAISALAFQPQSMTLVSSSADGTLRLWDATTGAQQQSLQIPKEQGLITSIVFSPDGSVMAIGALDGTVTLWNAARVEVVSEIQSYQAIGSVLALAFRPDGEQLAVSLRDGSVRLLGVQRS